MTTPTMTTPLDFAAAGARVPRAELAQALADLDRLASAPRLRVVDALAADRASRVRTVLDSRRLSACRHVLASAAISAVVPCWICVDHPGTARCDECDDQHVADAHARPRADELACDWCGADRLAEVFPVVIPLGSVTVARDPAARSMAARRPYTIGPAGFIGLRACRPCRHEGETATAIDGLFAAVEAL